MPVFISHRTADKALAQEVYSRLKYRHQIECWLDSIDADSNPSTITQQVLTGINKCTHLLALITHNTKGSWWVPYEVGVAEQGSRAITTFTKYPHSVLPEYLWHWPVLTSDHAIDQFAAIYKQERISLSLLENFSKRATVANSETAYASRSGTASSFHKHLKSKLNQ